MLVIKGKTSYYIEHPYPSRDKDAASLPPIPKLNDRTRIGIDKWRDLYGEDVDEIMELLVNLASSLSNESYICHIDIRQLKTKFEKVLYMTSENGKRGYS